MVTVTRPKPLARLLIASLFATTLAAGCLTPHAPHEGCDTLGQLQWRQPGLWAALPPPGEYGDHTLTNTTRTGFDFQDPQWGDLTLLLVTKRHAWEFQSGTGHLPFVLRSNETVAVSVPGNTPDDLVRARFLAFVENLTHAPQQQLDTWADAFLENRTEGATIEPIDVSPSQQSPSPPPSAHYHVTIEGPYRFEAHYEQLIDERGLILHPDPHEQGRIDLRAWSYEFAVPRIEISHPEHQLEVDARDRTTFTEWQRTTSSKSVQAALHTLETDLGLPPLEPERDPYGEWWLDYC